MKKLLLFICLFLLTNQLQATDIRLRAMGGMRLAVPDIEAQVNLYHLADNSAWLKSNDTTNWSRYTALNQNESGQLRRYWDSASLNIFSLSISGQKQIDDDKTFYGDIRYNVDLRNGVNKTLDKNPYDPDPFVLTDSTVGDFQYLGPEIKVAFNHQLTKDFYWGVSLNYNVNRGLKDIYTEPEIISRYISGSLNLIYRLSPAFTIGMTGSLYHLLDITKLTTQTDGQTPQTYRYRGYYEFRKSTGTSDRNAIYKGYTLRPQIAVQTDRIESVLFIDYAYLWHEIFDGTAVQRYEGYYQSQTYGLRAVGRYYYSDDRQSTLTMDYRYNYSEDWAKEANAGLLIHQAVYNHQYFMAGASRQLNFLPLLLALEISYDTYQPKVSDYLARQARDGTISRLESKAGLELALSPNLLIRAGYLFIDYQEQKVRPYFGDYQGHLICGGLGFLYSRFELDIYGRYGTTGSNGLLPEKDNSRKFFDFTLQLKHSF